MLGYLTVSLVDLIQYQDNPNLPITLHYVFLIIDPPYAIMGAIYYIDRVGIKHSPLPNIFNCFIKMVGSPQGTTEELKHVRFCAGSGTRLIT